MIIYPLSIASRRAPVLSKALLILLCFSCSFLAHASTDSEGLEFDDFPLEDIIQYPGWFKKSFLDLDEDLEEAVSEGKKGLVVYFGQKRCAYCKMLMDVNFGQEDIVHYMQTNFDLVPIDIWSPEEITDPHGNTTTQRQYSISLNTNFTPSLVFYDAEGRIALRLRGYYPPYQFRAAIEYVADGHYKRESLATYMARGDATQRFEPEDLNEQTFFTPAPYNLDRTRFQAERPLAVFFEQGNCHACDILHTQPLSQASIARLFNQFDVVQLNMKSDEPVITPNGKRTTAREWAQELNIFFAPSVVFFDESGKEVVRVDSVVRSFRLRNILNYMVTRGYLSHPNFQHWRANRPQIESLTDVAP